MNHDPPNDSLLDWSDAGHPRSRLYGDVYFSVEDGLAESRAVFLRGCGLPEGWRGRRRFTVGELGFGSGLNILALLDLWRTTRDPGARLHVFTVEAHPLSAAEAQRALASWPELSDLAGLLTGRWPGHARGFHRIDLPELDCQIDLAVMEAADALAAWTGEADAWFLDGFSPALNPAMWRPNLLNLVAARSAPGARAATFTVAGQVRRDLSAAGFSVSRQPGFGRKRQRLEARFAGHSRPERPAPTQVAVIGAGIAGASLARALRLVGLQPLVFDAEGPGAGASGNPAALVTPRLDAGLGPPAQLFAQAFARGTALFAGTAQATTSFGALQLALGERDMARYAKIAASDLFEAGELIVRVAPEGLEMRRGMVVAPQVILEAWLGDVRTARVAGIERTDGAWRLLDAGGGLIAEAGAVALAAGADCPSLWPALPLSPVRGQASWASGPAGVETATAWGGYAIPLAQGVLFGATHDRGDVGRDLRAADHRRNLATLAQGLPELAAAIEDAMLQGRASIRAATPDRLPLAGPVQDAPEGLYVLSGLGSRGFTLAPLLAEHVAAQIAGAPSPLPRPIAEIVDPLRFARRAARRQGSS